MGIEQIVSKIIDEARERAKTQRSEFETKTKTIESRWAEEMTLRTKEAHAATDDAVTREHDRIVTIERLESRKRHLALRRELVDKVFEKARVAFLELPKKKYQDILALIIADSAETGEETVVLSARDHSGIGKKVVEEANGILEGRGSTAALTLASSPGPLEAGAILRMDRVEIRRTLGELLRELRERLEGRIASVLFEGGA